MKEARTSIRLVPQYKVCNHNFKKQILKMWYGEKIVMYCEGCGCVEQ